MRTRHHRASRAGFTLVESLIAVSLLAILFLAVAQTSSRASDAFDEGSSEHALSTSLHRALERIARELEYADDATVLDDAPLVAAGSFGSTDVEYAVPASFDGGAVQWRPMRILAELEPEELDNGADDDGDGLVDERRVVLLDSAGTPDERRIVLVGGVAELSEGELANGADDNGNVLQDEAGLTFSSLGNVVFVRLTCQRTDEGGRLLEKTAETAVRLHN